MQYQDFRKFDRSIDSISNYYDSQPYAYVHSFGCQQNVSDGEHIKGVLVSIGYSLADSAEKADLVVFNTCAVREHAQQRVYGNIGALKALKDRNGRMMIAVCGCMMQQSSVVQKIRQHYPYVDIAFGVNEIDKLPSLIAAAIGTRRRVFLDPEERYEIQEDLPVRRDSTFKAWLPVMYGCDNFCSYCIVPFVRGRERSRKPEHILSEFRKLIQSGYREITLLGQNVNSYGKGLEEGLDFSDLLAMLASEEGDFRIRFMTSHPKDASRKLFDTIAAHPKICRCIHLPVQSGSDRILRLMNRRYDTAQYLELTDYARSVMPGLPLSSDIIVGFPGETQEEYEATVRLVERMQYSQLFTFIYSRREGTSAASMQDDTPYRVKADRVNALVSLQEEIESGLAASMIGSTCRALCEGRGHTQGLLAGRLENNFVAEFAGSEDLIGRFVDLRIVSNRGPAPFAELAQTESAKLPEAGH